MIMVTGGSDFNGPNLNADLIRALRGPYRSFTQVPGLLSRALGINRRFLTLEKAVTACIHTTRRQPDDAQ